jgi:hypothetical protein
MRIHDNLDQFLAFDQSRALPLIDQKEGAVAQAKLQSFGFFQLNGQTV